MSTKNLARTVIEGGRTGASKYQRRMAHRYLRAATRTYLRQILIDKDQDRYFRHPEPVLSEVVGPYGYEISFADRTNPLERWLDKQIGRKWNDVYREVKRKFDIRTTPGRHILYDHLLRDVRVKRTAVDLLNRYRDYEVDADGRLQRDLTSYYWRRRRGNASRGTEAGESATGDLPGSAGMSTA